MAEKAKMKKVLLLSLTFMFMVIARAHGAFEDTYWGVRALGMGGAFTAVANDSNAPLYNIAGIANATQKEVTLMGSRLFTGLEGVEIGANYFGFIYPVSDKIGSLSLAWSSLFTPGLARYDTYNIGYARQLNDVLNLDADIVNLSAGLNLKYLRQEINFDDDWYGGLADSKGGVTADAGFLAQFKNGISLGYSSKYITTPDIGFVSEDKVSNANVIGLSYYNELLPALKIPYFTAAVDIIFLDNETNFKVGLESYVVDGALAVRLGGRKEAFDLGFGYEFTFVNETKLIIDYALELPLEIQESMGSHFVSVSLRFGNIIGEKDSKE